MNDIAEDLKVKQWAMSRYILFKIHLYAVKMLRSKTIDP